MTDPDVYIKTAYTGSEHFTAGKYYPVWSKYGMTCRVYDDDGIGRLVILQVAAHVRIWMAKANGNMWELRDE